MDPKEEIKTRLDIVDVINEYVALKPAGANHKALCPFHTEKTPSFMVSRERQMWRCFGCSEGGDLYSFVMKMEGLDFPGALRHLAQKAGVTIRRGDPAVASHKNTLLEIVQAAANFWQTLLLESPQAAAARAYLKQRGVSDSAVQAFQLGFAPDSWDATGQHLRDRGFSEADLFAAGLMVKKERGAGFYDRFRNRLIFPIHDAHGTVVGFGGRALADGPDAGAKYINTPQTAIYNKGLVVFNLHRAKPDIRTANAAVLVEGYMDALASWEAGVKNVVAVAGTALTGDQVKLLKRFTANLAIAFDMDPAGAAAAWRGIDVVLQAECGVRVITLPFGKDPDECVRQDPAAWRQAISGAVEFMQYCFTKTLAQYPPTDATNKKLAAKTLLEVIGKLGNRIEQTHWLQQLANNLSVPELILRESLPARRAASRAGGMASTPSRPVGRERGLLLEERLVALLLYQPSQLAAALQWVGPEQFQDRRYGDLYARLAVYYNEVSAGDGATFAEDQFSAWHARQANRRAELDEVAQTLLFIAEREYGTFAEAQIASEVATICTDLRREFLRRQLKRIQVELRAAELTRQADAIDRLTRQFSELASQLYLLET